MTSATSPLSPLLRLPGVTEAVEQARAAVAEVHQHPANRRGWPTTAAEASVRAARCSAALDGGDADLPVDGAVSDPVLAGALRVTEALGPMLSTWQRAPLQALARLHVLAAADLVDEEQDRLGRPHSSAQTSARLDLLASLVGRQDSGADGAVPAPILVAVVHGELLALSPFGTADGVVARAAARLTLISSGLDPKGLVVPEVAWLRMGARYPDGAGAFASGSRDGVRDWLLLCCEAIVSGAREAHGIADAASS